MFARAIPIRRSDIDALGHVNNATCHTYIDELLTDLLGPVLHDDWVTARTELNFRSELRLSDVEVHAEAQVERVGSSSLTFAVQLKRRDGLVAADGSIVVVAWDAGGRRSRPLTDGEKENLAARAS
jgi:acyl-CoA thioester hydrolase